MQPMGRLFLLLQNSCWDTLGAVGKSDAALAVSARDMVHPLFRAEDRLFPEC